jgi:hypothetical protein
MRLSEAILLGSTVLAPKAGGQHFSENQAGCALGMAAIARGCSFGCVSRPVPSEERRTLGTEGVWGHWVLQVVMRPCACWRFRVPREMRIKDIIAHIFDYHVMQKRDWTLDRLAAWVETVEPKKRASGETLDPELLERISGFRATRQRQIVNESRREEDRIAANEWQARVSAFTAKHGSGQESGQRQGRSTLYLRRQA